MGWVGGCWDRVAAPLDTTHEEKKHENNQTNDCGLICGVHHFPKSCLVVCARQLSTKKKKKKNPGIEAHWGTSRL
jgi:hypothetical protein